MQSADDQEGGSDPGDGATGSRSEEAQRIFRPGPASKGPRPSVVDERSRGVVVSVLGILAVGILLAAGSAPSPAAAQQPEAAPPPEGEAPDEPRRGWIGISYTVEAVRTGEAGRIEEEGSETRVTVAGVAEDGPAQRAGVEPGDRIFRIDGRDVTPSALRSLARGIRPGERLELTVVRNGETRTVQVTAEERPLELRIAGAPPRIRVPLGPAPGEREEGARTLRILLDTLDLPPEEAHLHLEEMLEQLEEVHRERMGAVRERIIEARERELETVRDEVAEARRERMEAARQRRLEVARQQAERAQVQAERSAREVRTMTPWAAGRSTVAGARLVSLNPELGAYFQVEEGVLVAEVMEETPAAEAGLAPGDVIVGVGDEPVSTVQDLRGALRPAPSPPTLRVLRKGEELSLRLPR